MTTPLSPKQGIDLTTAVAVHDLITAAEHVVKTAPASLTVAERAKIFAASLDLYFACERMLPWIGKLIADGGHLNSVAPNDAIGAMQQAEAALAKTKVPKSVQSFIYDTK